jgi:hypothetical protein
MAGLFLLLTRCTNIPEGAHAVNQYPEIYPDYINITIPKNIAPLNFMMKVPCEKMVVVVTGKGSKVEARGKNKISFSIPEFQKLLSQNAGGKLKIEVFAKQEKSWKSYKPFEWQITAETIDPYLSYRLIEPGYEVWNKISIRQRNITNFDEKIIADNNLIDGSCINCHITNKHNPQQSFFHIRHPKMGGTVIANGNTIRKIDTRTSKTLSAGVYGNWHPSGKFIAFSTNVIIPKFHSEPDKRMEVYDTKSDLIVTDLEKNEVFSSPLISMPGKLETFPEFSADGRQLFFCVTDTLSLPAEYKKLKYSLCRIGFDPQNRTFGEKVDTLFSAAKEGKTVSEPKASPDGKTLMFTVSDYGTFPIWHSEAELYLLNIETGTVNKLPAVNEKKYSNSYHSWSSNSRWFVFASKRDDGMYGKPYFSFIDTNGNATKPFVLPQKDAEFYDQFSKSFNIPELFEIKNAFGYTDVERIFQKPAEKFTFRKSSN